METPKVLITEDAIYAMAAEAVEHENIETAFDLAGFIQNDGSAIVTNVLAPAPSDIVRRIATTTLGGEQQALAVDWLETNARSMKKLGLIPADMKFAYLHSGHSHHKLGFGSYSSTDRNTIVKIVKEIGLEVAIGPLITLEMNGPQIKWLTRLADPTLHIYQGVKVKIKFYYYSKVMADAGINEPIVIVPKIVDVSSVPALPPLSWRYSQPYVYAEQLRHLQNFGCAVQIVEREIHDGPPFETQFLITNAKWKGTLNVVTNWNFPQTAPTFELVNGNGPKQLPIGDWTSDMDLIDIVGRLLNGGLL